MNELSIIGGGIGGLTTAIALQNLIKDIKVYEGTPELKPVGAGLILANNAMQVYKHLGLDTKIKEAGNRLSIMKFTTKDLKDLQVVNLDVFEKKYNVHNVAIQRGVLQQILIESLPDNSIVLNKRLASITNDNETINITFEDKSSIQTKILLGADGIKSKVRSASNIATVNIRSSEQTCWRGICDFTLPASMQHQGIEMWDNGIRFGIVPVSANKVYWYAAAKAKYNYTTSDVKQIFKDFHGIVQDIIQATPINTIIENELIDIPPFTPWHNNKNICLLGDAAHPTTPNIGQGACQAIEDAYILSQLKKQNKSWPEIFTAYQNTRSKKTISINKTSWLLGKVAHWENSVAVALRNKSLQWTPASVNEKQLANIFELEKV